jgi:hypothetical protein
MEALLVELCVTHGWCLKPSDQDRLLGVDVSDSGVITDEIIRAELGEDSVADRATRAWLKALVDDWLFDPDGRGAASGLPL